MKLDFDPYIVLNIPRNASDELIKRAFRKRAKETHPDLNGGTKEAAAMFAKVEESYNILSDPKKKLEYDASNMHFEKSGMDWDSKAKGSSTKGNSSNWTRNNTWGDSYNQGYAKQGNVYNTSNSSYPGSSSNKYNSTNYYSNTSVKAIKIQIQQEKVDELRANATFSVSYILIAWGIVLFFLIPVISVPKMWVVALIALVFLFLNELLTTLSTRKGLKKEEEKLRNLYMNG